jgi:hypothetical protein
MIRRNYLFFKSIVSVCLSQWAHLLMWLIVSLISRIDSGLRSIIVLISLLISLCVIFFHIRIYFSHFLPKIFIEFGFIRIHFFPFLKKILCKYIYFFFIYLCIIDYYWIHLWYSLFIFLGNFNLIDFFTTFREIIFCLTEYNNIFCISFTNFLIFLKIYNTFIQFFLFLNLIKLYCSGYLSIFTINIYLPKRLYLFCECFWSISKTSGLLLFLHDNITLDFRDYLYILFLTVILDMVGLIQRPLLFYPKGFWVKIVISCWI